MSETLEEYTRRTYAEDDDDNTNDRYLSGDGVLHRSIIDACAPYTIFRDAVFGLDLARNNDDNSMFDEEVDFESELSNVSTRRLIGEINRRKERDVETMNIREFSETYESVM